MYHIRHGQFRNRNPGLSLRTVKKSESATDAPSLSAWDGFVPNSFGDTRNQTPWRSGVWFRVVLDCLCSSGGTWQTIRSSSLYLETKISLDVDEEGAALRILQRYLFPLVRLGLINGRGKRLAETQKVPPYSVHNNNEGWGLGQDLSGTEILQVRVLGAALYGY